MVKVTQRGFFFGKFAREWCRDSIPDIICPAQPHKVTGGREVGVMGEEKTGIGELLVVVIVNNEVKIPYKQCLIEFRKPHKFYWQWCSMF